MLKWYGDNNRDHRRPHDLTQWTPLDCIVQFACSGNGIGLQVLAAVDSVAEQLQASAKAKTALMQNYAIKCYTEILTPLQASSVAPSAWISCLDLDSMQHGAHREARCSVNCKPQHAPNGTMFASLAPRPCPVPRETIAGVS